MIRVGVVDFDTSHVVAFTQRLNHLEVSEDQWVEGARIVAGWPGDSVMSPERIPGYTEQLRNYGVELVERPEELFGKIDAVMIESLQGARHLERTRPFLERGLPTFVDKPFAGSVEEADAMIALAQKHGAPLMSCSALRYDPGVLAALRKREEWGAICSVDVWGTASLHDGNPGMLHYGVHAVEMLYTLMGPGCRRAHCIRTEPGEIAAGVWPNGRLGIVRGIREGAYGFGFTAHFEKGHLFHTVEGTSYYTEMLRAFVRMCETRQPPIDYAEMREIIAFIQAADRSAAREGVGETVDGG